ncbi:MAG: type II secretion system protein [Bacilli bacterium]
MKKTNKNINRRINNVRGFTLIELLAVIVVLAVIMLIAVNAVIPQMNNARRQAFAIEANGLVDSAQAFVVTASITGSGAEIPNAGRCITLAELKEGYSELGTKYSGSVFVKPKDPNSNTYIYTVFLTNGAYTVSGTDGKGTVASVNEDITVEKVFKAVTPEPTNIANCNGAVKP